MVSLLSGQKTDSSREDGKGISEGAGAALQDREDAGKELGGILSWKPHRTALSVVINAATTMNTRIQACRHF